MTSRIAQLTIIEVLDFALAVHKGTAVRWKLVNVKISLAKKRWAWTQDNF